MTTVTVYVPTVGCFLERQLADHSGVVGLTADEARELRPNVHVDAGEVLVYYEGNIYNSTAFKTYADRVFHAADRMLWHGRGYPTIAFSVVSRDDLLPVGQFEHPHGREIIVHDSEKLAAWLGREYLDHPTDPDLMRSDR